MFDFQLAIARLDRDSLGQQFGLTAPEILRERHPEFAFLANEIEDLRAQVFAAPDPDDLAKLEEECEEQAGRIAAMEGALTLIRKTAEILDECRDTDALREALAEIAHYATEGLDA